MEESLRILREVGDPASTAHPLLNLGALCMVQGDCLKARAYYEESLSIAQAMGDRRNVAAVSGFMGEWARRQADLVTARARYAESLRIAQALGGHAWLQTFLMGLGCVEVMSGEAAVQAGEPGDADYQRGVRLFGAVESVMERTGRAIWAHERADYERCVAVARAGLGEAAFEAAWAAGRAMSVDEAIRFALEEPGADVAAP